MNNPDTLRLLADAQTEVAAARLRGDGEALTIAEEKFAALVASTNFVALARSWDEMKRQCETGERG